MKEHRPFLGIAAAVALVGLLFVSEVQAASVQVLSATIKNKRIDGATVILQKNGETSVKSATNANGTATLNASFIADPDALLIIRKTGYSDLVAKCPCDGMTYAISPVMHNLDGLRIVLNWGATPSDLDSHLLYPGNHVFFHHKRGTDSMLDVDDTTSYGPETITIMKKHDGERYVYAVHDFSDGGNETTTNLSSSHAKVFVYIGSTLIRSYYVPKNKAGNLWTVFAISKGGEFQDYNTISGVPNANLNTAQFREVLDGQRVKTASYGADARHRARRLNDEGVKAYHQHNYDRAIAKFRAAIDIDRNFGQAYSNLGLVFQKSGRTAEALWANRKAIALAHGSHASTTRASSHYNNGRIYEAAGQWADALREYNYAKNEHSRSVYDRAIARMHEKLGQ